MSSLHHIKILDNKRLGKQRLEAKQILNILEYYDKHGIFPNTGWIHHKIVKIWMGHTYALKVYFNKVIYYWKERGFQNSYDYYDVDEESCPIIPCKFDGKTALFEQQANSMTFPLWYSYPPYYLSQRAALLMKDREYYLGQQLLTPEVEPYLLKGYLWPCDHGDKIYHQWNLDYLAPLGSGIPPEYRLDKLSVQQWIQNKSINPVTGRAIQSNGKLYKEYSRAAKIFGYL